MSLKCIESLDCPIGLKRTDWLHPQYGPYPEHAARYCSTQGHIFTAALWERFRDTQTPYWITAVEGPDSINGGLLHSLFWTRSPCKDFYQCKTGAETVRIEPQQDRHPWETLCLAAIVIYTRTKFEEWETWAELGVLT